MIRILSAMCAERADSYPEVKPARHFPFIRRPGFLRGQNITEKWSSRIAFLFAAIGAAVGLGSIWRFPAIVGENGGGAYLIPYLVAVFFCATPLMVLEFAAGRYFATDIVSAFRSIRPWFTVPAAIICATGFLILSYYLVVTGWTLGFAAFAATGTPVTFAAFTASYEPVICFLIATVIAGLIVASGVRNGIERVSTLLIPFIVILLLVMAFFVATLPGFSVGIAYLSTPDFSVIARPSLWISAIGQSFFTLSIGLGILFTYGAYLEKDENLLTSSLIISGSDLAISLLSGIVIFPIVFSFGLAPAMGAQLAFSTLPQAFAVMPYGRVIAIAFFLLLFLTAILSSIAMVEVLAAVVIKRTGWSRPRSCAIVTMAIILAGLPAALSYSSMNLTLAGVRILDAMDSLVGTAGIVISAILTSLVISWYVDQKTIESGIGSHSPMVRWVVPMCRTVIPLVLGVILVITLIT